MDPIIGGALIGGGTQLAGALLGGQGADKAAKAQERSQAAALGFAREQEATRQANFNRAYQIWDASRRALLDRYGITLPEATAPQMGAAPAGPGAAAPGGPAMAAAVRRPMPASAMPELAGGGMPQGGPVSLGQMLAAKPEGLEGWNDWQRYRLG